MKKFPVAALAALALAGCSSTWQLQVMPRDSGKIYNGTWQNTGMGGASTMTIALPDRTYSGPVVRTTSGHTYGFYDSFGWRGPGTFGTVDFYNGATRMKALLTSPDGHGLRCDFSGDGYHMGGICADDDKHVYDVIATVQ